MPRDFESVPPNPRLNRQKRTPTITCRAPSATRLTLVLAPTTHDARFDHFRASPLRRLQNRLPFSMLNKSAGQRECQS